MLKIVNKEMMQTIVPVGKKRTQKNDGRCCRGWDDECVGRGAAVLHSIQLMMKTHKKNPAYRQTKQSRQGS